MSLPPAVSVVGRDGEDHDEHADIHGGGEGGAAVPAEEHGGWSLPLTTLLSRFCSNHKSRRSLVVSYFGGSQTNTLNYNKSHISSEP